MQDPSQRKIIFRLGITLGLVLGAGWGFILGVLLVRLNSIFLFIGMVLTALPIAFLGSVLVGFAFSRLMPEWHRVACLLASLIFVAIGMPFGLAFGVMEGSVDPARLVDTTGALIWDLEWLFAILGLIGGTWPGWTRPFTERLGNGVLAVFAPPLALLKFIASVPRRLIQALARFFENLGHGFLWLPSRLLAFLHQIDSPVQERWKDLRTRPHEPQPEPEPRRRSSSAPVATRRKAPRTRASVQARRNGSNHNDVPRIVDVVEDRCPYCLDVVKRKDPRGIKICEVCGTPHHADCWAITGKCQVPHLNT